MHRDHKWMLALLIACIVYFSYLSIAHARPTPTDMRDIAHFTFDNYALVTNAKLSFSNTGTRGEKWTTIRVRVIWPNGQTERWRIRAANSGPNFIVGIDRLN